jgi:peptidoglycan/xylan/chitin deacetylase (PgdA/CDA1 family)
VNSVCSRERREATVTRGVLAHRLTSMRKRLRPLVLCYHAVSDRWEDPLAVSADSFERQLKGLLSRGYRPVDTATAVTGNGRSMHVTFDDAFRSVATAVPVLRRLGVPATVFACPGFTDGDGIFDVPDLPQPPENAEHLLTMDWPQLRELVESGVEVGSHTLTHPHLTRLTDEELARELRESRRRLEDELGVPCRFLAYPFGEEDERVRAAARASDYDAAFALPGVQTSHDRFAVPRVGIWRTDTTGRVALKTSAAGRRLLLDPVTSARERWPVLARGGRRPAARET